jgi:predicted dehydrogenase
MALTEVNPVIAALGRPLRLGVVGGGAGSFIGPIHRRAAELDGRFRIVAGALSSRPDRAKAQGAAIGLAPDRAYVGVDEMVRAEAARSDRDGIEAVAIMTPNDCHYAGITAALQAGLHVICDKPMVNSVAEAQQVVELVARSGCVFCLTHNYSGYPMVRQARAMVAAGTLGAVRLVHVEYFQGGMALPVEQSQLTDKLRWKLDAKRSGPSLVLGDIGTHAHQLASYVSASRIEMLSADVGAVVPGRIVDDYAAVLWRFANGARGTCVVTQAAAGAENNLTLRVYGEKGMLEWQHGTPNYLRHAPLGEAVQTLGRGDPYLAPESLRCIRISRGHPEGFIESFANLYADFAEAILARRAGRSEASVVGAYPDAQTGLDGLQFVEAAVRSAQAGGGWVRCS